jgi:hypothetical protein
VQERDVRVRHREAPPVERVEEAGGHQAVAEEDRVVARCRRGPHHPGATRRLAQGQQRRQGAHRHAAVGGEDDRVGGRLVARAALLEERVEARAVACERPALARRAPPGVVGAHLEVDDHVAGERVAHAIGAQRAAAERHHAAVRPSEQLEDQLLLAPPELRLALAVEERLDRLAERLLELAVGVERGHPELGRGRARGARLAGAHEAHEHHGAVAARPGARCRACRRYRLQPIRSR